MTTQRPVTRTSAITVPADGVALDGDLSVPEGATGVVIFAHGSGSSRHSPRNRRVATLLNDASIGTLLIDLLTPGEEMIDARAAALRFDIGLLSRRVDGAVAWVRDGLLGALPTGLFGASTGAAAALVAAAERPRDIAAVVSRGGRPDLAGDALPRVRAPTLLVVGSFDMQVLALNEAAFERLSAEKELVVVRGASHLFEEPGALDEVAGLAAAWFTRWFA
jgi:putative phosphoribosyl transferase